MTVILLFANDGNLLAKYIEYLPKDYVDILKILIYQDFTEQVNLDLLVNVVCKLIIYGVKGISNKIWKYLFENITEDQIIKIISICNNNQDYEQSTGLLSYYIYELQKYSDKISPLI